MDLERRKFLKATGLSVSVLTLSGTTLFLSPKEAKAKGMVFKVLSKDEANLLELIAEQLVPGATIAGVAYFVDEQLLKHPNDSLLMARYFQVDPPYVDFYKGALAVFNGYCQGAFGRQFNELAIKQRKQLIGTLFKMGPTGPINPEGWQGPPSALVYLCLRADAVDVVYGTEAGFELLNVPYMAHISPKEKW